MESWMRNKSASVLCISHLQIGQSTTSLSLSDPAAVAATIAVAPAAAAAESGAGIFCATLRMHLAHSVWKQLSRHGSVYLSPQLWNRIRTEVLNWLFHS